MNNVDVLSGGGPETEGSRNNPANTAEIGKIDFDFYARFAKPLILTLNCTEDRILAASWFSKIRDVSSGPHQLRLDYLKLLLFVLQRHHLVGPFTENPNALETLKEFGEDYELAAIARQIIEKGQREKKELYQKKMRGEVGDCPPYSTDYSADLREYVAAQDIPNFGVHVYYAISKDPILDWDKAEHAVIPKDVRRMEPQGHISETSFAIIEPKPGTPDEHDKCKILEETGVMPDESIYLGRKTRERKSPYKDIDRPAPPLGVLPGDGEEDREQELPPPTWGSNLIEVREPIDSEGPESSPSEEAEPITAAMGGKSFIEPDDPEIVDLLETSFNMEDILAEVDAMETEEPIEQPDEVDPTIIEEQKKFREIEAELDRHDAAIAEALASLDEDERRMLMEMEAAETVGVQSRPRPSPKKEVKLIADDDTVIKVLVEAPEAVSESQEETERKGAKAGTVKKKPAGRTGLNKSKAKGAILKPGEKKEIEEQEKNAKVVDTKTGIPSERSGVPKVKISAPMSEGEISEKESVTGKGKAIPGKGVPRKGIPRKATELAEGSAEMKEMKERLDQKLNETKEAYPEKFDEEQMTSRNVMPEYQEEMGARTPVDELTTFHSQGSPESDDIYEEMDREYKILERLYELYEKLAPGRQEGLRTPPVFSKHPEIRALGRQLRYRPDEFELHPAEQFQPATEYFAGEGAGAPSPFVDPRDAVRIGVPEVGQEVSQKEQVSGFVEDSPPWASVEELKRIVEKAEKSMNASPAISGGVGTTTPKSPSTPRRPARKNLLSVFEMESPPEFDDSPGSPPEMPTPEFLNDPGFGLPEVLTMEKLDEMFKEKQAEYDAYVQAEIEAEKALWPVLAPKQATPEPAQQLPTAMPTAISPEAPDQVMTSPQQRLSQKARSPPSVGGPGRVVVSPGTPPGLPPSMLFQYNTPPEYRVVRERIDIPDEPEFEEYDPLEQKELRFQAMPDLVDADLDEFDSTPTSPQFELVDWYDPLQEMLEAQEEPYMLFDMSDEMIEADLVPAEEDYRQYSPVITLRERLVGHQIPQEFFDPNRPGAKSKQVRIGSRNVQMARKTEPSQLARQIIDEDLSGEQFEEYKDEIINEDENKFLGASLQDTVRIEYLKKMADEAQAMPPLDEEEPPDLYDVDMDMSFGPPSPEKLPTPQPTPELKPFFGVRDEEEIDFEGIPGQEGIFAIEEPDFLASPGMPSPLPPPTPPPSPPASPPWSSPDDAFLVDDIFGEQIDEEFLASPGMPPGRTVEDELREIGVMSPLISPPRQPSPQRQLSPQRQPSPRQVPIPVQVPLGPFERPLGPEDIRVSPERITAPGVPYMRMRPRTPVGTPELDPETFRREMMAHRVEFAKREAFKAGQRKIPRRTPSTRPYFPIREHAGYEESKELHEQMKDYSDMLSTLPPLHPMPPTEPLPEELMGYAYEGRFPYSETLLDQPLPDTGGLPSPLSPKREVFGWRTPPHLRTAPSELVYRPSPSPPPPVLPDTTNMMRMAARMGMMYPMEDDDFMGIREEDVFPEELQETYGSPRIPEYLMVTPPSGVIPTMTIDQQMEQAAQRAQWQAEQIAERSPPSRSPISRPPQRRLQLSPRIPSPTTQATPSSGLPPCARPTETSPKVLKRVQESSYSSGVYDPENSDNSKKWTRGRTVLEFNRPEEGDRRQPVVTPSSKGVPVPMPMPLPAEAPMPLSPSQRPMIQRRRQVRIPIPTQPGATPRGRIQRGGVFQREDGMPVRRRLFADVETSEMSQPSADVIPPSPRRVCPGAPQGERIEIVEEFEETEHDYIPEHLRGYKWMDNPDEDEFYRTFREQFQ